MEKSKSGLYHNGGKGMFVANYKRTTIIPAKTTLMFHLAHKVSRAKLGQKPESYSHLLPTKFVVNEDI